MTMSERQILRMEKEAPLRRAAAAGSWRGRREIIKRSLLGSALACAMIFPVSAIADTLIYKNARFGTTVAFPARIFLQAMEPPPGGEGMTYLAPDGASLGTHAMNNALELSPEEFAELANNCGIGECEMSSLQIDGYQIIFSGEKDGSVFHKRWKFGEDNVIHGLTIIYPSSTWEIYDELVEDISLSFGGR